MRQKVTSLFVVGVLLCFLPLPQAFSIAGERVLVIAAPESSSAAEALAAREVRRYLYLRTGHRVPVIRSGSKLPSADLLIVVGSKDQPVVRSAAKAEATLGDSVHSLQAQQYLLKTTQQGALIVGGDGVGTLYGAYRFAEHLGVRFYLHGDVVPDEQVDLRLPKLDERGAPLFETRGIQPFHDFPEGPDWWNEDGYKAILAQLPKLRMNFFALHTYPEGGVGPEPTVWIGLKDDVNSDGTVKFSSRSSYQNTLRGNWGYAAKKTGEYCYGTAQLFERDAYGPDVMGETLPWPETPAERNAVFNATGEMLREAFVFAHTLGIRTCVGTETPLTIPRVVKERIRNKGRDPNDIAVVREVYEGMFHRIKHAYPVDYYWLWTPESWTWGNPKDEEVEATVADLRAAIAVIENVGAPFTLATCGWVLGPPGDRALFDTILPKTMPMSCINRNVGFAAVEVGFARVEGRPQWAIPWLEDDPALIIPQLWVGRMRRDAADALAYGCTGLLGIHWRTRILGPNVSALAKAAWEQKAWNPYFGKDIPVPDPRLKEGREGGNVATFLNNAIADTEHDPVYQTVVYNVKVYRLKVPSGTYAVRLQFCEPHYAEVNRRVFGVTIQGKKAIDKLDMFAAVGKDRALDYTFDGVEVRDGMLEIGFSPIVEYPCIAGIVTSGKGVTRKINCGGGEYEGYEADLPQSDADDRSRDLPADDFYRDWAKTQFGEEVASAVAELFVRLDGGPDAGKSGQSGTNLPRPSTWVHGPGGIRPDGRPWKQVRKEYRFVDELAALRSSVKGAGNLERFDYWLNSFRYLRAVGRVNCTWARFNAVMDEVNRVEDGEAKRRLACARALPVRNELIEQVEEVHRLRMATVTTTGGIGTITNWQQHLLPDLLSKPGKELAEALGRELPAPARPANSYDGPSRLIVPTVRTVLKQGEDLRLRVIIVSPDKPRGGTLRWRPLGQGAFKKKDFEHVARSVYSVTVRADQIEDHDIEYYVQARGGDGEKLVFPPTAPAINQTVVVLGHN
jgi:hypothetical protein